MKRFLRWVVFGLPCSRCREVSRDVHWRGSICISCGYIEAILRSFGGRKL